MWSTDKVQVSDKEFDNPWFGHLFVSLGTGREVVSPGRPRVWHPPTDVYETDDDVTVKVEVAGVGEEDFAIQLAGRVLTVVGRRDDPVTKLACQQMEISYGAFRSQVQLPCEVDGNSATAKYSVGFLFVTLPKAQDKRTVPVKVTIEPPS